MREIKKFIKRAYGLVNPEERSQKAELKKDILDFFNQDFDGTLKISTEKDDWKNLFLKMLKTSTRAEVLMLQNLFIGFSKENLTLIKRAEKIDPSSVVALSAIKNNIVYLKTFLPYYRQMGVGNFILIDNNSDDGTIEFLNQQDDVTLYSAPYPFHGVRKAGWKLQALANYGLNRWYLWLDSDEFLAYPEMESVNINEYLDKLYKKGIRNIGGFMLDMYPSYKLLDSNESGDNFYQEYMYFDTYNPCYQIREDVLYGGMRGRLLNIYDLRLDKTPLVYCSKENIPNGNHTTFPFRKNLSKNYGCVLKHYKFLSSDLDKFKARARDEKSGYSSFEAQKKYEELIGMTAFCSLSVKYEDSTSLNVFPFVRNLLNV
jgi:hypothetical protein